MSTHRLSYREIIPDQTILDSWREISVNTGGTQSTLQDIKVAERANGFSYSYNDASKYHTRNRFIYWRINHDILELVEHSLDINLSGSRIRYRFVDTPILDGVSIHETEDNVIVLVPTVCSVHRLTFPHPNKYYRQDDVLGTHLDLAAPSIFSEASITDATNPATFHILSNTSTANSQLPHLADSIYCEETEEVFFILAYPCGELSLIKQNKDGKFITDQLKGESLVPKFLSNLADKLRQKDKEKDNAVSVLLHNCENETYAIVLCRNGHLKFWSCFKAECIAIIDIMNEIGQVRGSQMNTVQNFVLRKTVDVWSDSFELGVYMNFSNESQLHIFQTIINGQQIQIKRYKTFHSPQNDLIDFTLSTSSIWSVWRGKDGECIVYTSSIEFGDFWLPVTLESIPDANQPPNIDSETDPRQAYLQYIFHPGRFPLHIISKALNIYKRSTIISDINLSAGLLKQQICMAVEDEIQNELQQTIVSDEDYLECSNYCWQRFYSCCVQYYVAGLKPLGLLLLPSVNGVVLLKKSTFSFLRPLDIMEHMILCNDYAQKGHLDVALTLLPDTPDLRDDLMKLFQVIVYLEQQMSDVFNYTFEKELNTLKSPDLIMLNLLEKIQTEMDSEFTNDISNLLKNCNDLYQTINIILELLRIDTHLKYAVNEPNKKYQSSINHFFSSQLGVSIIAGCLRQQAQIRFTICRNLLLISNILLERKEMNWNILETIRTVCTPEIVVLTQANYIMVWLSSLPALSFLPQESTMQRLSSLKLNPVFNLRNSSIHSISLLELFAGSTGGYEARKTFSKLKHGNQSLTFWESSLLPYLNTLFHVVWPLNGTPILAEWLLSCGQHLWLQQYVRLVTNWCEWNNHTHSFLLAASLLTTGENYKALELFSIASKGIFSDQFLAERFLIENQDDQTNQLKSSMNYYLKVIHLFELHKAYDCAIRLANTALSQTNPNDPLAATFYSVKFKHHLALKHHEMAYDSLNSNPDNERKKDNLRDLVKKLLDEKQLDLLMKFTYGNLEELFCDIIFARARASDAINNVFYDFLYAYQIKRGPSFLRLAASVMYEQAFRLSQLNTLEALEKQFKCLLASKNSLQLCNKNDAWVVIPIEQAKDELIILPTLAGSNEEPKEIDLLQQIQIINLNNLKQELVLTSAKLRLIKFNPNTNFNSTDANELVVLLTNAGLFRTALEICEIFQLSNRIVFEMLTKKCVLLTKQYVPTAWKWLAENDLQDLPNNSKSASDVAWNLLQEYIENYEEEKMSEIHHVVCKQIIKMHMFIPYWLLASYKKRNPSELLRLLHYSGRFHEAVEVAVEYMMAALGYGKEYYNFTFTLLPTTPAFCLPIRNINNLLHQLKTINEKEHDRPFIKEYEHLKGVFDTYCQTAFRTSNEMCLYKLALARSS